MTNQPIENVSDTRKDLIRRLFPKGIPQLWCPTLTHFNNSGGLDETRIRDHWKHLSPYVKGVLVPGSTGEGWEMDDEDIQKLLEVTLDIAKATDIRMLIGVLKTDLKSMLGCIESTLDFLKRRTGIHSADEALLASNVVGFTVCPPKGSQLSQAALADAITEVARLGLPLAVYQLPQVTENELTAETIQNLALRFPEFYLFKDTSGNDQVALSKLDLHDVFLVRGAEGNYPRWLKSTGGPYHGLLLSTANVFAAQLSAMQSMLVKGQTESAEALSGRITHVIEGCFKIVEGFSAGNVFTNANKMLDHLMAFGEEGLHHDPPMLYSGVRLTGQMIEQAADLLRQEELFPARGYLASGKTSD